MPRAKIFTDVTNLRFPPGTLEKLRTAAIAKGLTTAQFVRNAVARALAEG